VFASGFIRRPYMTTLAGGRRSLMPPPGYHSKDMHLDSESLGISDSVYRTLSQV